MFARKHDHTTVCRLCQQPFDHKTLGVPIIGETAPVRVQRFIMGLTEHLDKEHKKEAVIPGISGAVQDFFGLLVLQHFDTDDPGLQQRGEAIRADIHRRTRRNFIADEKITELSLRIFPKPETEEEEDEAAQIREEVAAVIRGIRDAYEEIGAYAPDKQVEPLILPA